MKVSDYIVDFIIKKGITDVFGYPGGMVTHLMESFRERQGEIQAHVNYHEQASAFAACGYAQISGKPGIAYATSGPGATNLITGICNAYFDSIPTVFITGQVNTFEAKSGLEVRQKGFQETDISQMVKGVTKYCEYVKSAEKIRYYLEKAFYHAEEGRPGPVLLDIPMDIQRADVDITDLVGFEPEENISSNAEEAVNIIEYELQKAKRPCVLLGAGVKADRMRPEVKKFLEKVDIPVVTSMLAFDIIPSDNSNFYGFIGAYGKREANFVVAKSDLLIAIGSRLDVRQIGAKKENFAPRARLIRIDVDKGELSNKVKGDEIQIQADAGQILHELNKRIDKIKIDNSWLQVCAQIRDALIGQDDRLFPNRLMEQISKVVPDGYIITTDVGQNQVWTAQSFRVKSNQKILFSGGHGAMGYSLPAAIGAYYGRKTPVVSLNGDGGFQMNVQEMEFIKRERLPISIVVFNNHALGMIRHFQEMYFDSNYTQTISQEGYEVPDLKKISMAYDFRYVKISREEDIKGDLFEYNAPQLVEVTIEEPTYVFPKLEFGKPNQDQEPLIDRKLYHKLMEL